MANIALSQELYESKAPTISISFDVTGNLATSRELVFRKCTLV